MTDIDVQFLESAKMGDLRLLQECLARGVPANVADEFGRTALHEAAAIGQVEVLKILHEFGANPNAATQDGWTPLCEAAKYNHSQAVALLLAHGAISTLPEPWSVFDTALKYEASSDVFKALMSAINPDMTDRHGCPIVEAAISRKRPDVVSVLFEAGASDQTTSSGDCRLLALAVNEFGTFVLILDRVKAKMAPQALVELMSIACGLPEAQALAIIERLLSAGADPQLPDSSGASLIQRACLNGQRPILELVLRSSALPMDAYAWIEKGALDKVDECENEFFASSYDQGPRRLHRWDPRTQVALRSYLNVIDLVRTRLALPSSSDLLMISILGADLQLCRDLIAVGTEVDARDRKGRLPLVEAVGRAWGGEFRDLLLQQGAEVNQADVRGCTPLLTAVWVDEGIYRQEEGTIRQLLRLGANPNLADCNGHTPMMKAAQHNNPKFVKLLWDAGSFSDAVDVNGRGVLDFARTEQDRMYYQELFASGRGGD